MATVINGRQGQTTSRGKKSLTDKPKVRYDKWQLVIAFFVYDRDSYITARVS
ncbi:hypothetical protein J2S00_000422 [Caldalkalibacillus uzonensis]|uniref:Transposase n=1 Tax=Caldalkalibacillus uzonensis TaxID=353224 RepID=A0ABU0CRK0_9BACI|nr:hypothetical protein [Caldalkalibacillus uzonensis]